MPSVRMARLLIVGRPSDGLALKVSLWLSLWASGLSELLSGDVAVLPKNMDIVKPEQ